MEHAAGKIIIAITLVCMVQASALAEGPNAWLNVNYSDTRQYEDGKKTESSGSFFQNYYIRIEKPLTPLIYYQLYLRTTLNDSHNTDEKGERTSDYLRAVEPAFDLFLHNPLYRLDVGARRLEQWSTAHLSNKGRRTTEFYYSRFNLQPYELPALSLQADYQKDYDHLPQRMTDSTDMRYSASSWYDLNYRAIRMSYNITYMRDEIKTPVSSTTKSITDSLNALYGLAFNKSFMENRFNVSAGYQGNYGRNKNRLFAAPGSEILVQRPLREGLYAAGTQIQPSADTLSSAGSLIDLKNNTPATVPGSINLGGNGARYQNMGVHLVSNSPVDTIYIYVNKDIRGDTNLYGTTTNLEVYHGEFNSAGNWKKSDIRPVKIEVVDPANNIYRYVITLTTPQKDFYFKVVNLETASMNDVIVTEIEAYGTEHVSETGRVTDTTTFLSHGINLYTNVRPARSLTLSLNYFLNRSDQNPESVINSTGGAFSSLFRNPTIEKDKSLTINITRSYGGNINWYVHRLLTTIARFQRNEAVDNREESNPTSNTYALSLTSAPMKTLDATLSLVRTYSYSFSEKQSINDLYMLTVGSRLHRDVNMITDIGYTRTKTYALGSPQSGGPATGDGSTSNIRYIRGTLDAHLTNRLAANLTYGISKTSGSASSNSKDGNLILTYRPGRFFSISGTLKITDTDGDTDSLEGILIDWLFLPAVRINANYQHSIMESGSRTTNIFSGYLLWYITRFMELQLNYNYTRENGEIRKEIYNFGGNVTCRFW
jgi:hypothetical protein